MWTRLTIAADRLGIDYVSLFWECRRGNLRYRDARVKASNGQWTKRYYVFNADLSKLGRS